MRDPRRRRTSWRKQVEGYPRITVQAHALMGSREAIATRCNNITGDGPSPDYALEAGEYSLND